VRYIGTSTTAAWQFVEALWVSKELGRNRFIAETPPYNINDRNHGNSGDDRHVRKLKY
jgi:aryl-alcohol dehydrogenase-like predicted oxidoreductase